MGHDLPYGEHREATAYLFAQECIIPSGAVVRPAMIPCRKISRQHPPLATGSDPIEDRVQHFADIDRSLLT
jgi:hypothetical protein